MEKNKVNIFSILCLIISIVGFTIVIQHILGFSGHDYFYIQNPNIQKYVGVNVVSRYADFSYFTYQTIIIFSAWAGLYSISCLFNLNKLNQFLTKEWVVCFVVCNYIITAVVYTIFELITPSSFGLYDATDPLAWHNFGTNILAHYVIFIFAIYAFIKVKTHGKTSRVEIISNIAYLFVYYVCVKITGLYCYKIEWYPYIIFDKESLFSAFGISEISPAVAGGG